MNRIPASTFLSLACATMLASSAVHAQGRGPSVKEIQDRLAQEAATARATELAALDAWLRRLVGRFRITDMAAFITTRAYELVGFWDCVGIGSGPAVQCMASLGPADQSERGIVWMYLFGLDPDELGIRYLRVDGSINVAEGGLGKLTGDTVTFRTPCFIQKHPEDLAIQLPCDRKLRIHAPRHGKYVQYEDMKVQHLIVPAPPGGARNEIVTTLPPITLTTRMERIPESAAEKTPKTPSAR